MHPSSIHLCFLPFIYPLSIFLHSFSPPFHPLSFLPSFYPLSLPSIHTSFILFPPSLSLPPSIPSYLSSISLFHPTCMHPFFLPFLLHQAPGYAQHSGESSGRNPQGGFQPRPQGAARPAEGKGHSQRQCSGLERFSPMKW